MTEFEVAVDTVAEENLHCFVCDVAVQGRYYTLATCRTQSTKVHLIEKLGQLVGEKYMVVICEDDIICRGCANLINTLDRLETEMGSVRSVVLRFLEKKYSLEEGELLNNKTYGSSQPPQITPRTTSPRSENFMYCKRKAALSDLENEENSLDALNRSKKAGTRNDMWMQCDKCKYTTHYNAFMLHHVRQHVKKKKSVTCDYCGSEVTDGTCAQQCGGRKHVEAPPASVGSKPLEGAVSMPSHEQKLISQVNGLHRAAESESQTVEIITGDIGGLASSSQESTAMVSGADLANHGNVLPNGESNDHSTDQQQQDQNQQQQQQHLAMARNALEVKSLVVQGGQEMIIPVSGVKQPQLQMGNLEVQMNEGEDAGASTTICVMEMPEQHTTNEPTLLTVQKMDSVDSDTNAVYVQVVEVGKEGEVDENSVPKVLTVSDDGTVEMVEVMWDDVVTSDQNSIQF